MRPRLERALFCCLVVQSESLALKPWECAPCDCDPDPSDKAGFAEQRRPARQLADRLRAAGLSIYEPDPIAALEETAARVNNTSNETKGASDDQITHDAR